MNRQGLSQNDLNIGDTETLERSTTLDAIHKAVESARVAANIPGMALAIVKDDRVILMQGYGLRNVDAKLPVTTETLFNIASITKTVTALAVVISADKGRISLEDSPRKFLPYFKLRDPGANSLVSLRDLLSHRTGVPNDLGGSWYERYSTRELLIKAAMQSKPAGTFRKHFAYNNFMVLAAGEALGKAYQTSYEEVVKNLVFTPVGMEKSNFSIAAMEQSGDFSYGYSHEKSRAKFPLSRLDFLGREAPAAAMNSNVRELAQLLRLLLNRGVLDGRRLMSDQAFNEMLANHSSTRSGHYALGLFIEERDGHRVYFHTGGVSGYGSRLEFIAHHNIGFIVLTNVDDDRLPKAVREIVYENLLD
ncbi:MAG: serine hydrolase domain-containing protein [Bacteroidota bacterium]